MFAALLSAAAPGTGQVAVGSHRRTAVRCALGSTVLCAAAVCAVGVATAADPAWLTSAAESAGALRAIAVLCLVAGAVRVWAALDAAWSARPELTWWFVPERAAFALLCATGAAAAALPAAAAGWYLHAADRATGEVFAATEPHVAAPGAKPPHTLPPDDPWATLDRLNVLLLGADAGPGRVGLRTDSVVLLSVDPRTGDTAAISVPRNLQRVPLPVGSPLAQRYPNGFTDTLNALYQATTDTLGAPTAGVDHGAAALKGSVAELLGVPVHYYVLVDMAGFVDIVDALGGVRVMVPQPVPTPGNPPDAKRAVPPVIDAGEHHMDGTLALAYARSRSADSDYQRMGRQRCLLAALAGSADPATIARVFPQLTAAVSSSVSTDIPRDRISDLVELATTARAAGAASAIRSLVLTPPVISPSRWDPHEVRALAAAALTPPPAAGTAAVTPPASAPTATPPEPAHSVPSPGPDNRPSAAPPPAC